MKALRPRVEVSENRTTALMTFGRARLRLHLADVDAFIDLLDHVRSIMRPIQQDSRRSDRRAFRSS
jgi:hypothetical protein